MGKHEKQIYLEAIGKRYRRADALKKGWILDVFCSEVLITHLKCRTIFRSALTVIIDPSRSDIRMAQPFLYLRNIRLMIQRIGRSSRA